HAPPEPARRLPNRAEPTSGGERHPLAVRPPDRPARCRLAGGAPRVFPDGVVGHLAAPRADPRPAGAGRGRIRLGAGLPLRWRRERRHPHLFRRRRSDRLLRPAMRTHLIVLLIIVALAAPALLAAADPAGSGLV